MLEASDIQIRRKDSVTTTLGFRLDTLDAEP